MQKPRRLRATFRFHVQRFGVMRQKPVMAKQHDLEL